MKLRFLQRLRSTLLLLGLCASGSVVQGQVYTFTNATATGPNGPTQAQVTAAYASTTLAGSVTVTGGIQFWTVPTTGNYKIEAWGANGYGVYGGKGAYMSGEFTFTAGDVLKILVGQEGQCCNSLGTNQYGGGGGSFVVAANGNTPLIIAGGGGGAATFYNNINLAASHNTAADASITTTAKNAVGSTAGTGGTAGNGGGAGSLAGGGGGFLTDGLPVASGGFAFVNGGAGGAGATAYGTGGFGGGGGATSYNNMRGGGGGGYSGGGGAGASTTVVQIGGGGGSFNSGTNQVNTPGLGTGHGQVVITSLAPLPPCAGQPSVGTVSASAFMVCNTQTFTLSMTGSTTGTGITRQWQSRVGTAGPWTNIAGATNMSYAVTGQTATSQYRAYISCANGGAGDTSLPLTVLQGPCYCVPTYTTGGANDGITNVQLGTLANATTGNVAPYYIDYTTQQPSPLSIPEIQQGVTSTVAVTMGSDPNQYAAVWVDFDQNGTFDASEYFTTSANAGANGTLNIPINVPLGATQGITRMRIRGGDNSNPSAGQACGASNSANGEAEDYLVNIKPACNNPVNVTVNNITTTTATATWGPTPNPIPPIGQEYVVSTSATPPASGTYTGSATVNLTGLTPNTVHYLHVRNQCTAGFSGWTTVSFKTSSANCPGFTTGLAATNITYNSADISWNLIGGAIGYEYIIDQNLMPPATGSGTPIAGNNFNTGATLTHGTTYYLHVRTVCPGPAYSAWRTISFTTLSCDMPSSLNAINITVNSATVGWNPVPGVLGYEYVVITSATPPASGTFTTNLVEPVSGLNAGTTYYLHVRSNCDVNVYSDWRTYSFQTLPCSAPAASAGAITFNSATLAWTSLPGALGYEYSFGTVATPPATGTATTALIYTTGTTLTPNTTYYFHVRAQCGPTTFSPWTTVSFTTPTCLPPVGLSFSNITTGMVTMSWGAPGAPSSTATSYEYTISQSSATPAGSGIVTPTSVVTASNTSVPPISALQPDTWYYVHVRSVCYPSGGLSDWILDSFKTLEPCPAVTGLKVHDVWFDAIDVTWNSAPYSNYYQYSIGTSAAPPSTGTNITDTTFRARGLKDNSFYYAHVRSMCTQVPSSIWQTIQFKTTSLSVNGVNSSAAGLSAYPNPVTDKVTVEWSGQLKGTAVIELTDVTGKVLKTLQAAQARTEIDMAELSPAIYFIRYHAEGQQAIIKINKE